MQAVADGGLGGKVIDLTWLTAMLRHLDSPRQSAGVHAC